MAEIIDTDTNIDEEGPPPYVDGLYITLPPGYGEIRCHQHRWAEGSEWGVAIGDYNRGEIVGERATLESRTSEENDTEDVLGNGERTVVAKLAPGPSFKPGMEVELTVHHTLWGTLRVQAMSNVEKNPPAVAASADLKWKQFDAVSIQFSAVVKADKQNVFRRRSVKGQTEASGNVEMTFNGSGIPTLQVGGAIGSQVSEDNRQSTMRTSVNPIDVHQIISSATDTDKLSLNKQKSKAFQIMTTNSVASNVGDTDGFADASMRVDQSWVFEAKLLDKHGNIVGLEGAALEIEGE